MLRGSAVALQLDCSGASWAAGREGPDRPGAACHASPGQLPPFSLSGDEQAKGNNLTLWPERLTVSQAPSHASWMTSVQLFTNVYGACATRQARTDQGTNPRPPGPTALAVTPRRSNMNRCSVCDSGVDPSVH